MPRRRRKPRRKPGREPRAIEARYIRTLTNTWEAAQRIIEQGLAPLLRIWPKESDQGSLINRGQISWGQDADDLQEVRIISNTTISRQLQWIELHIGLLLTTEQLEEIVDATGRKVSRWTRNEMERVLEIDLRSTDAQVARFINIWREHNIGLIETGIMAHEQSTMLRPSLLDDVSRTVEAAHARGTRVETLKRQIIERFEVSNSRAQLIARDQVLKLNGQITRQRQMGAGVTHYIWSTSRDERVRPYHEALEGETIAWNDPPEVAPGRHEHAGMDFQCRCVSLPILPGD